MRIRVDISDLVTMFKVGGRKERQWSGRRKLRCREMSLVNEWVDEMQLESRSLNIKLLYVTLLLLTSLLASIPAPLSKKLSSAFSFFLKHNLIALVSCLNLFNGLLQLSGRSWTFNMAYKYPSWSGLSFLVGPLPVSFVSAIKVYPTVPLLCILPSLSTFAYVVLST